MSVSIDKSLKYYTDGACSGNPGPGGWGYVRLCNLVEDIREYDGAVQTTNNVMELTAMIEAMRDAVSIQRKSLRTSMSVEFVSDSAYVLNAIVNGWIHNWNANGWKRSNGEVVKNKDLWVELYDAYSDVMLLFGRKFVKFTKVKGHSGDYYNEVADSLAVRGRDEAAAKF